MPISKWFEHPIFEDPRKTQSARWLSLFFWASITIELTLTILLLANPPGDVVFTQRLMATNAFVIAICFAGLHFTRRGFVQQTAVVLTVVLFGVAGTVSLVVYKTIINPAIMTYFILIPLAGLLLGKRAVTLSALLAVVSVCLIYVLEMVGLITSRDYPSATLNDVMVVVMGIALNTLLQRYALQVTEQSAEESIKIAGELAIANESLKDSQRQLQNSRDDLEVRVAQRTQELRETNQLLQDEIAERVRTEITLREAKDQAEAATRAKSEFLANMSHEIRTPMNGIIGMSSLLLDTSLTVEQLDFAETIRHSSESLLNVISDILDFSKIESGNLELELESFDLHLCVEGALDLLAPQASSQGLELTYLIDQSTPRYIFSDRLRLRQILVNLLSNAVKFTEEGEVFLSVTSRSLENGVNLIEFSVRDTGIGIKSDEIPHLFESFSQLDASNSRRYEGTGLGLAISKSLCELLGGRIGVSSSPSVGSTFYFSIVAPTGEVAYDAASDLDVCILEGKSVLIVDDNETNQKVLKLYVERWKMRPTVTSSADAALRLISNEQAPDVLLLDHNMPQLDGIALAKAVNERRKARLPIIILSSAFGISRNETTRQYGIAECLRKPIKPLELEKALTRLFGRTQHEGGSGTSGMIFDNEMATRYPLRILLAEDNLVNQKVTLRILDRLGYQVDVVANGEEAVGAVLDRGYDVVLMDVQMPVMDGLEATERIRQTAGNVPGKPYIIAMTAAATELDRERCLAVGMNDFVSKPAKVENIIAALVHSQGGS